MELEPLDGVTNIDKWYLRQHLRLQAELLYQKILKEAIADDDEYIYIDENGEHFELNDQAYIGFQHVCVKFNVDINP